MIIDHSVALIKLVQQFKELDNSSSNSMQWIQQMNQLGKENEAFFFLINFKGTEGEVLRLADMETSELVFDFGGASKSSSSVENERSAILLNPTPCSLESYKQGFDIVKQQILKGYSYLTNFTKANQINPNASLESIFHASRAKYKILNKDKWVCFSPETFVQINELGRIATFPMKGTMVGKKEDVGHLLQNNQKELAEHHTIVDLLRNDLNMVARGVRVDRFMYVDEIQTQNQIICQASSEISGQLQADWKSNIGNIFEQLLPAGSVSGAPKRETMDIIEMAEQYDRGYYCGVAGLFDGKSLDSCVLIRFIEKKNDGFVYKSGGGITSKSDAFEEYREMIQKIYVPLS